MTHCSSRILAASSILALCAGPALADLSPADVWQDWQNRMSSVGYQITATETTDGNALVISDFEAVSQEDDLGTVIIQFGELRLTSEDADTVSFNSPSTLSVSFSEDGGASMTAALDFSIAQTGSANSASGTADAIAYSTAASSTIVTLDRAEIEGEEDIATPQTVLTLTNWNASSISTNTDAGQRLDQTVTIEQMDGGFTLDTPEGDTLSLSMTLNGLSSKADVVMPTELNTDAPAEALAAGLQYAGDIGIASTSATLNGVIEGESFDVQTNSGEGTYAISLDQEAVRYDFRQQNLTFAMAGSQIPFPVAFDTSEAGLKFDIPLLASEEAQNMSLGVSLRGLTVSDAIWGLFDPQGVLPRDPADLVVELDGTAKIKVPLLDEDAMEAVARTGASPLEPETLMLRAFRLAIAGAVMEASGGFSFTGAPSPMSGGLPSPVGALDLDVKGANGLLDNLVATGLVGDQEVMGARMMMGLLAVPVGEDHLQSVIEMTDEGHIIANGQRIQ